MDSAVLRSPLWVDLCYWSVGGDCSEWGGQLRVERLHLSIIRRRMEAIKPFEVFNKGVIGRIISPLFYETVYFWETLVTRLSTL